MKKLVIYISVIFFVNSLLAQTNEPRMLIMGVPQYLFLNGLRIDVDYCLNKNKKTWIVFSPQYYNFNSEFDRDILGLSDDYQTLKGAGIYITLKKMFGKHSSKGPYLAGSIGNTYYKLATYGRIWKETEEGRYMPFYENYNVNINKIGFNALLGYQFSIEELYIDLYMGFGMRYSIRGIPKNSFTFFNMSNSDFGYRGTLFVGGFRIGMPIF